MTGRDSFEFEVQRNTMTARKKLLDVALPLERCVWRAFTRELEFPIASVNADLRELLAISEEPRWFALFSPCRAEILSSLCPDSRRNVVEGYDLGESGAQRQVVQSFVHAVPFAFASDS